MRKINGGLLHGKGSTRYGITGLGNLFARYEKKAKNYLGLVQISCNIIIYKKIFLGYALKFSPMFYLLLFLLLFLFLLF